MILKNIDVQNPGTGCGSSHTKYEPVGDLAFPFFVNYEDTTLSYLGQQIHFLDTLSI